MATMLALPFDISTVVVVKFSAGTHALFKQRLTPFGCASVVVEYGGT